MADPFDDPEEKPLDPAVERVQRRLRRLMLISGLTLGLGIFAVFGAIVYRLFTYAPTPHAPVALAPGAAIPTLKRSDFGIDDSAALLASALDGNRLALTFAADGETTVVVIDLPSVTVVQRFVIRD